MNASELLAGHEIEELFARVAAIDVDDHDALREAARELRARMEIEERTLYPIARTSEHCGDGAYTVASAVLAKMESGPFDPRLAALVDMVDDAALEEIGDADDAELERIGDEIARRVEHAMIASTIAGRRGRRERDRARMAARRR